MSITVGIDLACRTAHQASLAGEDGKMIWSGRKFFTRPGELPGRGTTSTWPTRANSRW